MNKNKKIKTSVDEMYTLLMFETNKDFYGITKNLLKQHLKKSFDATWKSFKNKSLP